MLSYDDKTIKSIIHRFMNFEKTVKISAFSENDVCALIAYLRYESTILFHLGEVEYVFYPRLKEAILKPCYLYSKAEYEMLVTQLSTTVQIIRDQICVAPTMLERELSIHDALCSKVIYADDGDESHSIVGPLLHHRGVCDGISKTAKVLLQECGIKSHVVFGTAIGTGGESESHAWNMVCINDKWYHLDITFDNTLSKDNIRYDYFNISEDEILKDHSLKTVSKLSLINCNNSNDYYVITGLYFNSLDALKEYFCRCMNQKKERIQVRVVSSIRERDILQTFAKSVDSLKRSITYEEWINPIRNVYAWNIQYR